MLAQPLSFAQINLKQQETFANEIIMLGNISSMGAINTIGTIGSALGGGYFRGGAEHKLYCRIYHEELTLGIAVITQNQFDDIMEVALGRDYQTTYQSLQDILDWFDRSAKGSSVTFDDVQGRHIQLDRMSQMDDNVFRVRILSDVDYKVISEDVYIKRQYIERAQQLLNDENARKIANKLIEVGLTEHPFVVSVKDNTLFGAEKYTITETIDELSLQEKEIKRELRMAKKEKDSTLENLLQDKLNYVEGRKSIVILMKRDLSHYPFAEKELLLGSALDAIERGINADIVDTSIVESGFAAFYQYEVLYGELSAALKERLTTLYSKYKEV